MNTLSISNFRAGLFAAVLAVAPLSPALHAQYAGMLASQSECAVCNKFVISTGA
jgi:hypothetical protein